MVNGQREEMGIDESDTFGDIIVNQECHDGNVTRNDCAGTIRERDGHDGAMSRSGCQADASEMTDGLDYSDCAYSPGGWWECLSSLLISCLPMQPAIHQSIHFLLSLAEITLSQEHPVYIGSPIPVNITLKPIILDLVKFERLLLSLGYVIERPDSALTIDNLGIKLSNRSCIQRIYKFIVVLKCMKDLDPGILQKLLFLTEQECQRLYILLLSLKAISSDDTGANNDLYRMCDKYSEFLQDIGVSKMKTNKGHSWIYICDATTETTESFTSLWSFFQALVSDPVMETQV